MAETLPPTQRGHRQVGAHTLRLHWDGGTPNDPDDDINHVSACQSCHPDVTEETGFDRLAREDFDADGVVEGIQTEVRGLLAMIEANLPQDETGAVSIPNDLELTTVAQRSANYNRLIAVEDGSFGVHNPLFIADLLRATYEELTGETLTPPSTAPTKPWDVNGVVNIIDLIVVGQHFGERITPAIALLLPSGMMPDVDQSGSVDLGDLVSVSSALGLEGPPATEAGAASAAAWLNLERLPLDGDGALFRVAIHVSSADRVAGYLMSLDYDPSVMTLVGLGNGSYLARDENAVFWQTPRIDESNGRIEAAMAVALGVDPVPGREKTSQL